MQTIQIAISDELAARLVPFRDQLSGLVEQALEEWLERNQQEAQTPSDELLRVLALSGRVTTPQAYEHSDPYVRQTPVAVMGSPVSEMIVELRGSL